MRSEWLAGVAGPIVTTRVVQAVQTSKHISRLPFDVHGQRRHGQNCRNPVAPVVQTGHRPCLDDTHSIRCVFEMADNTSDMRQVLLGKIMAHATPPDFYSVVLVVFDGHISALFAPPPGPRKETVFLDELAPCPDTLPPFMVIKIAQQIGTAPLTSIMSRDAGCRDDERDGADTHTQPGLIHARLPS